MNISAVVCTYHGARWIVPQLESIARQSRPPDEIVVRDDCSSDETPKLIRNELTKVGGSTTFVAGETNVGSTANFEAAIALATGDVIVLSDQDDVWCDTKLERLVAVFEQSDVGLVCSDALRVNEQLQPLPHTLWEALSISRQERQWLLDGEFFSALLRRNLVTGATMAFRSTFRELVLPIPKTWVHDAWIALLISAVAPCRALSEPLISYRQHSNQQIGESKLSWYRQFRIARNMGRESFERVAENFALAVARLRSQTEFEVSREVLTRLEAKVQHWRFRARLRERRLRCPAILPEFARGEYDRFSLGWKSVVQDLFL